MKCVRELKKIFIVLKDRREINLSEVVSIFLKIRQLLELEKKYQNDYPIVNLYCNWVVHTRLKHSNTIYNFLFEVSKSISNAMGLYNGEDPKEATNIFINKAGNVLQISDLRKGIKAIFLNEGIDTYICDNKEWWENFITLLLQEISGKPLAFPEEVINGTKEVKGASKIFRKLQALPHKYDWDKIYSLEISEKNKKYHLEFTTLGRVVYVVELQGKEPKEAYVS